MKQYLFILGRLPELSRTELSYVCDEVFYDGEKALLIAENLKFQNPRNLPKSEAQLFLDRLGSVIRFGEILGEFQDFGDLQKIVFEIIEAEKKEDIIPKVGFTVYGGGKDFLSKVIGNTKRHFDRKGRKIRIENREGKNMSSGQLFDCRLLQKGQEFIIWKNGDSYLLVRTVANQNIRNYELRDRKKAFRDAKMGMLPPKLAQTLLNLAVGKDELSPNSIILDPFCGSGTVNIEAGIIGIKTIGSDLNPDFTASAKGNFEQMAEKFRYEVSGGQFWAADACQALNETEEGGPFFVATEGFLGENFEANPDRKAIGINSEDVLEIWRKFFRHIKDKPVTRLALCLPCWNAYGTKFSIRNDFEDQIRAFGFMVDPVFQGQKSFIYEREGAYVAREIVVIDSSIKPNKNWERES